MSRYRTAHGRHHIPSPADVENKTHRGTQPSASPPGQAAPAGRIFTWQLRSVSIVPPTAVTLHQVHLAPAEKSDPFYFIRQWYINTKFLQELSKV